MVVAAMIASITASIGAFASLRTNRRIHTNHGKNIGQHVEELSLWAEHHTIQDAAHFAEIRTALGLPPKPYFIKQNIQQDD